MKGKEYQTSIVEVVFFPEDDAVRTSTGENGTGVPDDWGLIYG